MEQRLILLLLIIINCILFPSLISTLYDCFYSPMAFKHLISGAYLFILIEKILNLLKKIL